MGLLKDLKIKKNIKLITGCKKPVKMEIGGKKYLVPCGKCNECRKRIIELKNKKEAE